MGILSRQTSPVADFHIEYLCGSRDIIFGPGSVLQGINTHPIDHPINLELITYSLGHVILSLNHYAQISKVGIRFHGKTKSHKDPKETQLFSIEEVLWDSVPKGKRPSHGNGITRDIHDISLERKKRALSTGSANTFLFAIKWPYINYPPTVPAQRSIVCTEYMLSGFVQLADKPDDNPKEVLSEPLYVEYRPRIEPNEAYKMTARYSSDTSNKDETTVLLAEASLTCTNTTGVVFGGDCSAKLGLLLRKSDAKYLPRKAKIEVYEIHTTTPTPGTTASEQRFLLSQESVVLPPDLIKGHHECSIPLKVHIPAPEIDNPRGAMGLPTLQIGALGVKYVLRVIVPLTSSRFVSSSKMVKTLCAECPIAMGNVKIKATKTETVVPRLILNSEGEGIWDEYNLTRVGRRIGEEKRLLTWEAGCEIPRFLSSGDFEEEDIA